MILLDTCALLWWTVEPAQLSPAATRACDAIERAGGCCSSISIWEIGIKEKFGKLTLPLPFAEYVSRVRQIAGLEIVAVDDSIWMESLALDWANRDPADRAIVATARLRELPIVTKDRAMAEFYQRVVW